ncbi:hypothetical protein ACFE04_028755 [Oxalis oulophora]
MPTQISKKRKFVADGVFFAELNEVLTRELAEDGYSGVEVRVTPMRTEIIIRATRTQNVLSSSSQTINRGEYRVKKEECDNNNNNNNNSEVPMQGVKYGVRGRGIQNNQTRHSSSQTINCGEYFVKKQEFDNNNNNNNREVPMQEVKYGVVGGRGIQNSETRHSSSKTMGDQMLHINFKTKLSVSETTDKLLDERGKDKLSSQSKDPNKKISVKDLGKGV